MPDQRLRSEVRGLGYPGGIGAAGKGLEVDGGERLGLVVPVRAAVWLGSCLLAHAPTLLLCSA